MPIVTDKYKVQVSELWTFLTTAIHQYDDSELVSYMLANPRERERLSVAVEAAKEAEESEAF